MWAPEKKKVVDAAISQIEKQFGKGAIMQMSEKGKLKVPVISTGNIGLDHVLGVGGFPRGRVIEIFGPESSGKTTLTLHVVAEAQKLGGVAAFIDAEHALDLGYAKRIGVKVDELLLSQPDNGEQALEITDVLVRSGAIDIVVIDSVAALVPKAEITGEMGDSHMGLQARLMSQALRKLTATMSKSNTMIVFINQLRQKIGVVFGNPEVTTGGQALKFYASLRLDIRRIATIKDGDSAVGNRVRVKVVKNKLAPPFGQIEFDIQFGQGISKLGSLIDLAVEQGILQKSGSWYAHQDQKIGQGKENTKRTLTEDVKLQKLIEKQVWKKLGFGETEPTAPATPKKEATKVAPAANKNPVG